MSISIRLRIGLPALALSAAAALFAQTPSSASPPTPPPPPAPAGVVLPNLRPALAQTGTAIVGLNLQHWKLPGDLRAAGEEDADSIERDLTSTLPSLIERAEASAADGRNQTGGVALAPSFTLFRNLDALYDVLLRLSEMAAIAGSSADADRLEDARAQLATARGELGNTLIQAVTAQDAQLAQFRAVRAAAPNPPPPPAPVKIVVDDGPAPAKTRRKKPTPPPQ